MNQPAIEDLALLSNRRSAALVAHGRVAWWCVPRFDSPAVFAALLGDETHGSWRPAPLGAVETGRRYRDGSFILETDWQSPEGTGRSIDFLSQPGDAAAEAAVTLIRQVHCTAGTLDVSAELVMRFDYGRTVPWVRRRSGPDGEPVLHATAGPDSLTLRGWRPHLLTSLTHVT